MNRNKHFLTGMKESKLSARQIKAITGILGNDSIEDAARKAGVSRSTIYNWLKQDCFIRRIDQERKILFEEGLNALKSATSKAARTLILLLEHKDQKTRRLAAKEIINFAIKAIELKELEERVSQLEDLIERNKLNQKRY